MKAQVAVVLTVCAALLARAIAAEEKNYSLGILEEPRSQVVSSQQEWATFSCRVEGEDLQWYIDDKPPTTGGYDPWIAAGAKFTKTPRVDGQLNSSVTLPTDISYGFNSTRLSCVAYNSSNRLPSANAVMTIAGPPLPPHPRLNVLSATELRVLWDEPFTWDGFPILDYTVTVYNTSVSATTPLHTYTVTDLRQHMTIDTEMTNCSLLTFNVSARNDIGTSKRGMISGGFPVVPKELVSSPEASVRFTSDGTPEVKISFQPPIVCGFQTASYQVKVYSAISGQLVAGKGLQLIDNTERVVEAEISAELAPNAHYDAVITYKTQFTSISANTSFSTAFHPTAPVTTDEDGKFTTGKTRTSAVEDSSDKSTSVLGDNLAAIISSAVLGFVIVATIILIIITSVVCVLRRQLNKRSGERIQREMVDNPLYEGPIYECMPENKKRKLLVPKSKVNVKESLYLDSPTQSLPHDSAPAYDTLGAMVRANTAAEDKHHNGAAAKGVRVSESDLDRPQVYQNTMLDPPLVEDAYTVMSPALAASNGVITCHTNYQATSNGDIVSGRYVMNATTPLSNSLPKQQQITLV